MAFSSRWLPPRITPWRRPCPQTGRSSGWGCLTDWRPSSCQRRSHCTPCKRAGCKGDILAAIRQAGLSVEDVEIRKADLEDVFLDVMQGRAQGAREGVTA